MNLKKGVLMFSIRKKLDLYKREELLKIREELSEAKRALIDDWSNIEHTYHSTVEAKKTEIAKLDALIEAKKAILEQDNNTCLFLKGIIENLSRKPDSK